MSRALLPFAAVDHEKDPVDTVKISIRRGTTADALGAWQVFQAHQNWATVWFGTTEVVQRRLTSEFLEQLLRVYPSAIALSDDVVVGFAVSEARELGVMELVMIYVDDAFRDQGIGSALLHEVENQCHPRGISNIISFSSDKYFPGKQLPSGLFQKCGYEVRALSHHAEMYLREIPLTDEEQQIIRPVRKLSFMTVEDLEEEEALGEQEVVFLEIPAGITLPESTVQNAHSS